MHVTMDERYSTLAREKGDGQMLAMWLIEREGVPALILISIGKAVKRPLGED